VAIAFSILTVRKETLRYDEVKVVLGARHGHVEQPSLLFNLGRGSGAEVGRNTTIDDIEDEDRLPLLAFGGMNGREDEIILIEYRHASLVAGRVWRIESQFRKKALARRIAAGDLFQLNQIGLPRDVVLVDSFFVAITSFQAPRDGPVVTGMWRVKR
jgi:hypothetical protein